MISLDVIQFIELLFEVFHWLGDYPFIIGPYWREIKYSSNLNAAVSRRYEKQKKKGGGGTTSHEIRMHHVTKIIVSIIF
jgi:hypothetical protein